MVARSVEPAASEAEIDKVRSLGLDALRTRRRAMCGRYYRAIEGKMPCVTAAI